jgi:hypothetical protein
MLLIQAEYLIIPSGTRYLSKAFGRNSNAKLDRQYIMLLFLSVCHLQHHVLFIRND